jgi:hypothetical protein
MVAKGCCLVLGRNGWQCRGSFGYRLRCDDERWPFVKCTSPWGAYQILEEVALLSACELLGSCHHQIRRTDEYRCRRLAGQTLPNDHLSLETQKQCPASLHALISADKTCREHANLQTASFALHHLQLSTAPLCLLSIRPIFLQTATCFSLAIRVDLHLYP